MTSPELQKAVACVCNHAMHGRLVQDPQVPIRLLALHVRLYKYYSIATQPADCHDYLISKLYIYFIFLNP